MSSQPSRLDDDDLSVRTGKRDPRRQSAAAAGNDDARVAERPSWSTISSAGRALSRHDRGIVKARDDDCAGFPGNPRRDRFAALGAPIVEDDLRAFCARAVDFHLRSVGRHDDDGPDCQSPGRNGDAARVVARREGDDAPLPLLRRKLEQSVGRSAQLEGAARLQTLAFQPDAGAPTSLSISGVRSTRPAIRSDAATTSSRVTMAAPSKSLIFMSFRSTVAV